MERRELIGECRAPNGALVTLHRESGQMVVRFDGEVVMSDRAHGSEEELARHACGPLRKVPGARVVVGGLGLGYTARAALDTLGEDASVTVVEWVEGLIEWNRGALGPLANHPLNDSRTSLVTADIVDYFRAGPDPVDAIVLDVDNGPEPLLSDSGWLYSDAGLQTLRGALAPGGTLGVWSASPSPGFEGRLGRAGFEPEVVRTRARGKGQRGGWHVNYYGHLPRAVAHGGSEQPSSDLGEAEVHS